jgi:peroxiredoxin
MKTILKIIFGVCLLSIITYLITNIRSSLQKKASIEARRSQLPDFQFANLNGENITKADLNLAQPTVIISFMPTCHFCQYEAKAIKEQSTTFEEVNLLMVTSAPKKEALQFAEDYNLKEDPNILVLTDEFHQFQAIFGTVVVPAVFIYDKKQNLTKHFSGETKIEAILKYLEIETVENSQEVATQ